MPERSEPRLFFPIPVCWVPDFSFSLHVLAIPWAAAVDCVRFSVTQIIQNFRELNSARFLTLNSWIHRQRCEAGPDKAGSLPANPVLATLVPEDTALNRGID